jgi:adenosine kinase
MEKRKILITGSIAYDFIMNFSGNMNQMISTDTENNIFNLAVMPEDKIKSFGGTAGNIGYNLSLIGAETGVVTSVGQDFIDLGYQDRINAFPSVSFEGKIHQDSHSATCYIVNDQQKNQLIIFHRGAMIRGEQIKLLEMYPPPNKIKIASLSPDFSPATLQWAKELAEMNVPYIFDPGQVTPEFSAESLRFIIPNAHILIGNEYEISMILNKLEYKLEDLLKLNQNLIITKGSNGSECHFQGEMYPIPICQPTKVEDPTGAGDGYRAGLLFGLSRNLPFKTACQLGSVVASFVVETLGPQSQHFTREEIVQRYETNFHRSIEI